jgi:hypothetical protein
MASGHFDIKNTSIHLQFYQIILMRCSFDTYTLPVIHKLIDKA